MATQILKLSELGYYAPIALSVEQARIDFLAWADSIPAPVSETIKEMARGNKEAPLPGNLVGERDAFWLGELFGVSEETQQIAALGCIAGYAYVMHQDRSMDEGQQTTRHHELARNYLYAKILESFQLVSGDSREFWMHWDCYLNEYTEACVFEAEKAKERSPYSAEDLKMVARRSGLVKGCVAAYVLATKEFHKLPRYEDGIDQLAIGLQIRDDLADWRFDIEVGQYTYVTSKLCGDEPHVFRAAVGFGTPGTIESLLRESTQCFQKAASLLQLEKDASLQLYLNHLIEENAAIQEKVMEVRESAKQPTYFQTGLVIQKEIVFPRLEY